jgi:hypothetical protein
MEKHTVQNCRWAQPTLFLPLPLWLEAWETPWSCRRREPTRLVESATECAMCRSWEPRSLGDAAGEIAAAHRVP